MKISKSFIYINKMTRLQTEIDFGARFYDPFTARWTSIGPLCHKYFDMSLAAH